MKNSLRITLGSERGGIRVRRGSPPSKRSPSSTQKKTLRSFLARVCPVLACPPFLRIAAKPLKSGCDTRVAWIATGIAEQWRSAAGTNSEVKLDKKGLRRHNERCIKETWKARALSLNAAGLEGLQCVCSVSSMREGSGDPATPLIVVKVCSLHRCNTSI